VAAGLDLVEVNPEANPPVCRLMDFEEWKSGARKRPDDIE
jgi:translation initiation factor IF-3